MKITSDGWRRHAQRIRADIIGAENVFTFTALTRGTTGWGWGGGGQGRRIRGFEGARAPPEYTSAPSHRKKHPLKMKGNFMKHRFRLTSNKFMVVLTFILGLYRGKTVAIYRSDLN